MDGVEPEQEEEMDISMQPSLHLQQPQGQGEHHEDLPQEQQPYLGELEQDTELEVMERPRETEEDSILYRREEEEMMESSAQGKALMERPVLEKEFPEEQGIPEHSADDALLGHVELADQVDEISEGGQVNQGSVVNVPMKESCAEPTEEHLEPRPHEMDLENIYTGHPSSTSPPIATPKSEPNQPSFCDQTTPKNRDSVGIKMELSIDQESGEGKDLNVPEDICESKHGTLAFSLDPESKEASKYFHLGFAGNNRNRKMGRVELPPNLHADGIDTKPEDVKFSLLPDSCDESKPDRLELPIKTETKIEAGEDGLPIYPDSSEVKPTGLLGFSVKPESLDTKAEQLDYSVKTETMEAKPEGLDYTMKPESLDSRPEGLSFTDYSNDSEIKPEMKPEGLGFVAYPDSSDIKPDTKPEGFVLAAYAEVKVEAKQELLEADSTVLTPKLEQTDGLAENMELLEVKGQVKEERPKTPGRTCCSLQPFIISQLIIHIYLCVLKKLTNFSSRLSSLILLSQWWRVLRTAPGLQLLCPCVRFLTACTTPESQPSHSCSRRRPSTLSLSGQRY